MVTRCEMSGRGCSASSAMLIAWPSAARAVSTPARSRAKIVPSGSPGSTQSPGLVVITNPTHFAVALHYEKGMNAPVCLAKGTDLVALKIRELAAAHSIPIVENPPLARALHATVEIDEEIPTEHYKAVAEIIGYVMKLCRGAGSART